MIREARENPSNEKRIEWRIDEIFFSFIRHNGLFRFFHNHKTSNLGVLKTDRKRLLFFGIVLKSRRMILYFFLST